MSWSKSTLLASNTALPLPCHSTATCGYTPCSCIQVMMWWTQWHQGEHWDITPQQSKNMRCHLPTLHCLTHGGLIVITTRMSTRFCQLCWMAGCRGTGGWRPQCAINVTNWQQTTSQETPEGFMVFCSLSLPVQCMMTKKWRRWRSHFRRYNTICK